MLTFQITSTRFRLLAKKEVTRFISTAIQTINLWVENKSRHNIMNSFPLKHTLSLEIPQSTIRKSNNSLKSNPKSTASTTCKQLIPHALGTTSTNPFNLPVQLQKLQLSR
ncbi:hypothetical protein KFK09_015064 [Dendrobium nobile]|uniref:Uncharacterized protein n=1 Tax=Dendrobium nobile TaxID=94219 RepID=A0A8T3B3G0_DENNO|nr:hypothetical protein KFK09_015064 [Dendrobium nobile]